MTLDDAAARYQISAQVLRIYKKQQPHTAAIDDSVLATLDRIATLCAIGLSEDEILQYLSPHTSAGAQLSMLESQRKALLGDIHAREEQLSRLDVLRHTLRKTHYSGGLHNENSRQNHL